MPSAKSRRRAAARVAAEDERIALLRADAAETRRRRLATTAQTAQEEVREEGSPDEELPTVQELAASLHEMVAANPESEPESEPSTDSDDNDAAATGTETAPRNDDALTIETRLTEIASQVHNLAEVTEANRSALSTTEATMASLLDTVHNLVSPTSSRDRQLRDARARLDQLQRSMVRTPTARIDTAPRAAEPDPTVPSTEAAAPEGSRLNIREALNSLDVFRGNSNKQAEIVDPDEYVAFTQWFDACVWKLTTYGAPETQFVRLMSQKLEGAALKAFMARSRLEGWDTVHCTLPQFRVRLGSLFERAALKYTKKAFDMTFKASTMPDSLQRFRLYMQQSSFGDSLDGNAYIYSLVRDKMHAAVPQCLIAAASEFQLTLSEEEPRFNTYIDQAIRIATRLQAVRVFAKRGGEGSDAGGATERPAKKSKIAKPSTPKKDSKQSGGGGGSPGQKRAAIAAGAAADLLKKTDKKLLKKLNRCQTCGWLPASAEHDCRGGEGRAKRVEAIRTDLENSVDPNDFGKAAPFGNRA